MAGTSPILLLLNLLNDFHFICHLTMKIKIYVWTIVIFTAQQIIFGKCYFPQVKPRISSKRRRFGFFFSFSFWLHEM